ncbi:MAG: electron transfer flavoprotein subunit alpha [Flavobacteriales bacterium]|nr:MAG: electron transfer flavoprotein subunit alpha [Flavobacteriales bacterium]
MSVLVFADSNNGKLLKSVAEVVSYGSKIAGKLGTNCIALTYGEVSRDELEELGNYGASKVLAAKNASSVTANLVVSAANDEGADVIIFSHDGTGKAIAPRVAAKLDAGIVTGVIDYPNTDSGFIVKRTVFSGKAFANVSITSEKKIISLMPNSVGAEATGGSAEVVEYTVDAGETGINVKEFKKKGSEGVLLTEADIVVSAGRGLKGPENWGIIEELAKEMGAATACSRPVADIGWRPHHEHVGQTGIAVRPNLYIAIGISGAIQHLAGVNQSKVMVVINTDSEAPFFKAADYGIVGDAFQVVPKLIEAYKKFKASQN